MYDNAVNDNKIDNLNKKDGFHLHNDLVDNNNDDDNNNNYIKQDEVVYQQDGQAKPFWWRQQ